MESTTFYVETPENIERGIQYKVMQSVVDYNMTKRMTSAEARQHLLYWLQITEVVADTHEGLRACHAALQIINIRMSCGKQEEQKHLLRMKLIVNERRFIYFSVMCFDMDLADNEMMMEQ